MIEEIAEEVLRQQEFMHRIGFVPSTVRVGTVLQRYLIHEMVTRFQQSPDKNEGEFTLAGLKVKWTDANYELALK